jgi:hypothetical protein
MIGLLVVIGLILVGQLLYMMFIRPSQGDGDIGLGALSVIGGCIGVILMIIAGLLKIFL